MSTFLAFCAKLNLDVGSKWLLPPTAAKDFFERHVIFMISLCEIMKMTCLSKNDLDSGWGCVKSLFMALLAKLYLDGDIFLLILRSKINKKMSPSKESFAAAGGRRLFSQPRIK